METPGFSPNAAEKIESRLVVPSGNRFSGHVRNRKTETIGDALAKLEVTSCDVLEHHLLQDWYTAGQLVDQVEHKVVTFPPFDGSIPLPGLSVVVLTID